MSCSCFLATLRYRDKLWFAAHPQQILTKFGKVQFGINTNLITHNPLTYDGEYQDHDSGLIYLRARFYNPKTMRFMQRDSYNLLNRYAFANSNPVNHIDPNGHSAFGHVVGGFFQGLGDGLLSGATIGLCSHYGCSVDNYRQLATGGLSGFVELFNPIAAMVPLIEHGGNAEAWANAVGMSLPNMAIMAKDLHGFSYARSQLKNKLEEPYKQNKHKLPELANQLQAQNPNAVFFQKEQEGGLLSESKQLKAFNSNKVVAYAAISRKSGINYWAAPVVDLYNRYINKFKAAGDPELLKFTYRSAAWHASLKLPQSVATAINRVNMFLYSINTNNLNQYNVINNN
ncbi:RHS repeat-associated core domain-containing protein [Cysteiniphilum sp. JM-1]|uniref:RHS repeat-associated core domain-containing protein n=1 Tax=Cysteiniphilum sp. JM-1 TaxID=2610891 RepID=UPI001246A36E|nr:RHS repeat-associated core domain-containing protein [Cysteiniphilum sp. JM-1]